MYQFWMSWEHRKADELPRSKRLMLLNNMLNSALEKKRAKYFAIALCDIVDDYLYGKYTGQRWNVEKEGTPPSEHSDWD